MIYFLRVQQQFILELSYQQVITNLQVLNPIQQLCNNKIHVNNIKVLYCQKQALLSNNQVSQQFISQKYHSYFSLYTEKMKDVIVNFQVLPLDLSSFYLFGTTENILIQNSKINVKISQVLAESALICFKCNLHAIQSSLVFIGFGSNISGLVLISKSYITLENCSVQSRLSGKMVGGLVMQSNKITIYLKDSSITSHFNCNGSVGALISFATDSIQIQSSNVKMCTNMVKNVGFGESFVTISGGVTQSCQICENMKYSYGICINSLDNSEEIDYKLVCKPVFVFDGEACSCQDGKVLNGSSCINILEATSHLLYQFESFDLSLIEQLFQQVCGRRLIELRGLFYVINFVETKQCQACQYFHFANNQQNSRKRLQPFNRQITIFVFNIYQNILFVFQITLFIFYKCVCTLLCHFIHQYAFYNTLDTNDILCTNTHICYYIICSRHITHLLLYIHDSVYMPLLLVLQLGLLLVGYNLQFFVVQLQFHILLDLFSFNQLCFQHNPLFQFLYILDAIISSKKTHQLILLTQNQLLMVMQKVENFNHDIYKIKICEITLLNVRICKFSWYSQRTT
ncbi:Hypothetical_protein [Hexamita inflata]|uniref:Hypothetical_protein n=1 Tax=Hexamita inflata TaxID=28002 RepID=A0AA86URZ1_9EUKA|nr:Hypothetical protein HINF_LOCUS56985 [Hexamita inflata]